MSEREGTGQRRMRIAQASDRLWLAATGTTAYRAVSAPETRDLRRRVLLWPADVARYVATHASNMHKLMRCSVARTLAESGRNERKSAPIDEWRKSSGLGKPAEQLLRTLCAMGQMSRVKKRDPRTGSPRKVWHYGFFDALSYYGKVPEAQWPTRSGVTVSRDELQRYGGAWDVAERQWVDQLDGYIRGESGHVDNLDPRTLAVGIACGRYVVNGDGTVSMAITGWGATTAPLGELDGEPVYDTGRTDDATGLPMLDVERPADPHSAERAFRAMGEAIDRFRNVVNSGDAVAPRSTWTKDDNFPLCDTDPVEVHRFVVLVYDHEEAGREECRRRIDERCHIDQVFQSVSGEGQTIIAEWHDLHPLNLTSTDGDTWFQAEHAKQTGTMPPDVEAIVTMRDGMALEVPCGGVERGREVDALRARVAELEAERDRLWKRADALAKNGENVHTKAAAWKLCAQNIAGHALGLDVGGDDPKRVQADAVEGINRHINAAVEADTERDAWRTALLTATGGELPAVMVGPEANGEALREYIDGLRAWRNAAQVAALYLIDESGVADNSSPEALASLPEAASRAAYFAREAHEARESLQTSMYQNSPLPDAVRQRVDTLLARIQELAAERDAAQTLTYTPGELRAIRDSLDNNVEGVLEDAGMWKADKLDRIERVAHHAAALARTLRALNLT